MNTDIRNLSKWLNEEQEAPIDRQALARVLVMAEQPAQRTWVGLTNDEVNNLAAGCHLGNSVQDAIYKAAAKLKEKNT